LGAMINMKRFWALGIIIIVFGVATSGCSVSSTNCSTGNLKVLVISADNIPVAGAKVVSNAQPEGQLKVTGITGDDGIVIYENIKAGSYGFYVSRFAYIQQEFRLNLAPARNTEFTISLMHE
jgi:hypothetical protein